MSSLVKFLNNIHKEYVNARKVKSSSKIIRGRSRSISSISEDLFAELLCSVIKSKKVCIFVDQPISIDLSGKKKAYYPDIVICTKIADNKYIIHYMLDLKMDIGWQRNSFIDNAKNNEKICNEMKNSKTLGSVILISL